MGYVWLVIVGLYFIALIAFGLIGGYIVVVVMRAALTLTRALPETPCAERSDKAKEKHAESLLTVSNAVASATFIAVLVVPFTAFVQAVVTGGDLASLLSPFLKSGFPRWQVILLIVLFFLPVAFSIWARKQALDIYDEIAKPAPVPPLGPNGPPSTTCACLASTGTLTPSGVRRDTGGAAGALPNDRL